METNEQSAHRSANGVNFSAKTPNLLDAADTISEVCHTLAVVRELAAGWAVTRNGPEPKTANGLSSLVSEQIDKLEALRDRLHSK